MASDLIDIDGSVEEAGGQILRVALSLSAILGKPFRIRNVRAGRPKPGLQPQHLAGLVTMAKITNAEVSGAKLGSTELTFSPKGIVASNYDIDIGTAGSVTLLAQTVIPAMLFANRRTALTVTGGTHVNWSPNTDYYENVFIRMIRKLGAEVTMSTNEFGWFPRGGGKTVFEVSPSKLKGIELGERGLLYGIEGVCSLSNIKPDVLSREEEGVGKVFPKVKIKKASRSSQSPGTSVTLWAEFENTIIGASGLGKIGLRAEELGEQVAMELKKEMESAAVVDRWMADQLLLFMALSKGRSRIIVPELTPHAKTCSWLIPMFTNTPFEVKDNEVSVEGIGDSIG